MPGMSPQDRVSLKAICKNPTVAKNLVSWLEYIDTEASLTAGTVEASKLVKVDANKDIGSFRDVTVRKLLRSAVQTVDMNDVTVTLTAATITSDILYVDPGGNTETLLLPPEADMTGALLLIVNTADAAEDVTVKDDADNDTIVTVSQNEIGFCCCDGSTWRGGTMGVT